MRSTSGESSTRPAIAKAISNPLLMISWKGDIVPRTRRRSQIATECLPNSDMTQRLTPTPPIAAVTILPLPRMFRATWQDLEHRLLEFQIPPPRLELE